MMESATSVLHDSNESHFTDYIFRLVCCLLVKLVGDSFVISGCMGEKKMCFKNARMLSEADS